MAVAAAGARREMTDWPQLLGGAAGASAVTALSAWWLRRKETEAIEKKASLERDVAWNTQLLKEGEAIRLHHSERIAVLEDNMAKSQEKIFELEGQLIHERQTVGKLMVENERLREMNESLQVANTKLMEELNEERVRNREWEQKILALQEQAANGK